MPHYYRERINPDTGKTEQHFYADNEYNEEDLIYLMPGGLHRYETMKEIVSVVGKFTAKATRAQGTGQVNVPGFISGKSDVFDFKETVEPPTYSDPELQRIENEQKPLQITATPKDMEAFLKNTTIIKVEGRHEPEPAVFRQIVDFKDIPVIQNLDSEETDAYTRKVKALPTLTQIKRGAKVVIYGENLRVRPLKNSDYTEGLYLHQGGKRLDLTDFLEVNTNSLLLLAVPMDLPLGRSFFELCSGWYADDTIMRAGVSDPFDIVAN